MHSPLHALQTSIHVPGNINKLGNRTKKNCRNHYMYMYLPLVSHNVPISLLLKRNRTYLIQYGMHEHACTWIVCIIMNNQIVQDSVFIIIKLYIHGSRGCTFCTSTNRNWISTNFQGLRCIFGVIFQRNKTF